MPDVYLGQTTTSSTVIEDLKQATLTRDSRAVGGSRRLVLVCPGVLVGTSIPGDRVARFLDELAAIHNGYREFITVDNGSEFISNALDQWASKTRSR